MPNCYLLLSLAAAVLISGCSAQRATQEVSNVEKQVSADPDQSTVISLTPEQRIHVLDEMNQFLLSTQEIVEGVASSDPDLIESTVSDGLGRGQG